MHDILLPSLSRRRLLRTALLGGAAAAIAACSASRTGTVTTVTIDVPRLVTDGRAIIATLTTALALPGMAVLLGANLVLAEAALAAAGTVMTEIAEIAGATVSVRIDTARVQSLVVSLLGDVQTVLALLQTPPAAGVPALPSRLQLLIAAAVTLVPLVQQAAGLVTGVAAGPARRAPMSETEALRIAAGG